VYFTRPYHSIVDDSVALLQKKQPQWQVVEIPAIGILHYGYTEEMIQSLNKYDRARIAMEGFYRNNPHDPYVCNKLGALYLRIGKDKEGVKLLKTGLKAGGANPHIVYELNYHLANAYAKEKKYDSALKHYQKALTIPLIPKLKLGAYNNLGSLLQIMGDLQNSLQAYQMVVKIDPSFPMGYYNLGMTRKMLGQLPLAIEAYEKAIELNPNYAAAYQNLGVAWLKCGDFSRSQACFQAAVRLYDNQSNHPEAQRLREELAHIGMGNL
jgi:tetratricopeptide (TPR) repeat protein